MGCHVHRFAEWNIGPLLEVKAPGRERILAMRWSQSTDIYDILRCFSQNKGSEIMVWNQQFTHSLNVWCKQVQGLLRQAHTTSCNRARPVECVVWVIRKCSMNLSATWFSDNMCVYVCVCHENSSSCLLCFTACFTTCSANLSFPLEFILSSVSSKGERADQDDWRSTFGAFEGGVAFFGRSRSQKVYWDMPVEAVLSF